MNKTSHDVLIRSTKILNVILMTVPFAVCWFRFYLTELPEELPARDHFLVLLLFLILYAAFGRIYEAFLISKNRISEMVFSQSLAVFATDAIAYLIVRLMVGHFSKLLPMIGVFFTQILNSVVWCTCSHRLYYHIFPPQATTVVYDTRLGLDRLIHEYGLAKKYEVQRMISAGDCVANLELLQNMDAVFLSGIHSHERNIILKYCISHDIDVLVIPRIGDVLMNSAKPIHMFHLPVLDVHRYHPTPEYLVAKRLMDILLSLLGLIVLSPVMAVVAAAVYLYDRGPVLYKQVRLTKDGMEFEIHKFRSMRVDAEKDGVARLSTGAKDDRITPVGRVLRRFRLDELPQLVDILGGKLSLVGPRPERPEIAREYMKEMPEFSLRLQAKAGLTGYAQVYGKYNSAPYDKLQMDLMYLSHPSLIEDLKIILATVKILFMPESTEGIQEGWTTASK